MRIKHPELWVLGGILVVAVGVGVYLHFGNTQNAQKASQGDVTGSDNYSLNSDKLKALGAGIPDLKREVQFGQNVSASSRTDLQNKIDVVRSNLSKDANRADDWLTLAILYHGANDFDGARDVWEFLLKVLDAPKSAVVYDNLGKLYKYDLKDFPKSEMYFKASIEANPNSLTPYTELAELYRYLYKTDTTLTVDILNQAALKFPNETDPYVILAEYYRDKGQNDAARAAYAKAIARAHALGKIDLENAIRHDMDSVPQ